jgi:hypothetical protein
MRTPLCAYANALGEPLKGAHAARLGGFAAVDLLGTAALAWLVGRGALGRAPAPAEYLLVLLLLIIISVIAHEAFCVRTRLTSILFDRPWPPPAAHKKHGGASGHKAG